MMTVLARKQGAALVIRDRTLGIFTDKGFTPVDFKVELAPFQVLVGSNASGKSNLFDALHLLSRLAEVDLRSAFQGLRGSPASLC